mmetsp:Transcript_14339/g.34482  ORF Transcript_14339/g.34482 Transcript_14339/m.34482 type:complete len:232 (-) Transcript_14339:548-1243(-)
MGQGPPIPLQNSAGSLYRLFRSSAEIAAISAALRVNVFSLGEDPDVLLQPLWPRRLGYQAAPPLRAPAQQHLPGRGPVRRRRLLHTPLVDRALGRLGPAHLHVGRRPQRREARDVHAVLLRPLHEEVLAQVRVALYLQHRGRYPRRRHEVRQQAHAKVAHPDVLYQTLVHQRLHCPPGLRDWHGCVNHHGVWSSRVVHPLRRVALLEGHVLERDGEVHVVQVQVLKPQVLQ